MATYQARRHDLGITNVSTDGSGTTVVGMMLARDKNNVPKWGVHDAKLLVDQFTNSVPSPEYTNPEEELLLGQADWRSGFGLEYWDSDEPTRYYSSIGADLRWRNMAVAGPIATAIAIPTYGMKITDPGLETWTDPNNLTNWALTQVAGTTSLTQVTGGSQHSGTYAVRINTDNGEQGYISQVCATWNNNYRSKAITIKYWGMCSNAGTDDFRMVITDGVDTTTEDWQSDIAWAEKTITHTFNVAATKLEIRLEARSIGGNGFSNFDGLSTDLPYTGKISAFAEFNDLLYMGGGNILWKLNGTGDNLTFVESFITGEAGDPGNMITDIEPFTDDRLYIARGTSLGYYYMSTAEAFTASNAVVTTFQFFKTVHTATPVLWGNDGVNTIRSNTNPINGGAAWSAQTTVGSSFYNITELITKSGALYIMKEDMPYYLDSTGAVQNDLAPELQALTASTSGKNAKVWRNKIYIPCGTQSLLESATANTFIDPSSFTTNLSDFAGQVMALAYDEENLFAAVDNSTKIEILAYHNENWHPINEISLTGAECMYVSTVYQKRLWVASTSSSDSLYYIPLPTGYGNITADANRSFKTGSYFITPYLHANFRSTQKAFIKLTVTLGHAYDADIYITAAYEKIGDTSWTSIGNFDGTSANRMESIYIPVDASSNKPVSTMMRFKFTFVTDDTQKTPIMLNYSVKGVLYPEIKKLIAATIRASDDITCKNGAVDKGMRTTIDTTITNAINATWPVTIYDIDGSAQTVKFLPLPRNTPRYTTITDDVGREQERYYNLLMMITPLS